MRKLLALAVFGVTAQIAVGDIFTLLDPSGLGAEVEFTFVGSTLTVRAQNISTGVPAGFEPSDAILTGISWDFGDPGSAPGDVTITGGQVLTGPSSHSLNFSLGDVGANIPVSGEWAYSNSNQTGLLQNFITANWGGPLTTPFPGANMDGPVNIDGPQGGLVANPFIDPPGLGGLGVIQDEIIATLNLSGPLTDLSFLGANLVRVEFGSDAAFITVPAPGAAALGAIGLGLVGWVIRRRFS